MSIVKRTFESSAEAISYAQEHVCLALVAADTGVVAEGETYVVYELVEA